MSNHSDKLQQYSLLAISIIFFVLLFFLILSDRGSITDKLIVSVMGLGTLICFAFYHKLEEFSISLKGGIKAKLIQENKNKQVTEEIKKIVPVSKTNVGGDISPININEAISGRLIQIYGEVKKT